MDKKLYPLYSGILIEPIENKTSSGLILTENISGTAKLGKVVGVGLGDVDDNGKRKEMSVKVGETIAYSPAVTDRKVMSEGKQYLLVLEREVYGSYGVVEENV